jgi:hypothetical protein
MRWAALVLALAACSPAPCSRTAAAALDAVCGEAAYQAGAACRGQDLTTCPEYKAAVASCSCAIHAQEAACSGR